MIRLDQFSRPMSKIAGLLLQKSDLFILVRMKHFVCPRCVARAKRQIRAIDKELDALFFLRRRKEQGDESGRIQKNPGIR